MKSKLLICFGLVCLIGALGLTTFNLYQNHRAEKNAYLVMERLQEMTTNVTFDLKPKQMQTVHVDGHDYIGSLKIPSLDLNAAILSESSDALLNVGPCCYSGSFLANNLVIGGHNYRSLFGKLHQAEVGMNVTFYDVYEIPYEYQIAKIEILNPYAVDDLKNSSYDLSLYTCTNDRQHRLVVRCLEVE